MYISKTFEGIQYSGSPDKDVNILAISTNKMYQLMQRENEIRTLINKLISTYEKDNFSENFTAKEQSNIEVLKKCLTGEEESKNYAISCRLVTSLVNKFPRGKCGPAESSFAQNLSQLRTIVRRKARWIVRSQNKS